MAVSSDDFDAALQAVRDCIGRCTYLASTVGVITPPKRQAKSKNIGPPQDLLTVLKQVNDVHSFLESERPAIEKVSHWHCAASDGPFGKSPHTCPTAHGFALGIALRMQREMYKLVCTAIRGGHHSPTQELVAKLRGVYKKYERLCDDSSLSEQLKLEYEKALAEFRRQSQSPSTPPADGTAQVESDGDKPSELTGATRLAYRSFVYAEKHNEKNLQDREAHDWLKEYGISAEKYESTELAEYQLPAFGTWSRYLREARNALDKSKYTKRAGRPHGKSIVHPDEL